MTMIPIGSAYQGGIGGGSEFGFGRCGGGNGIDGSGKEMLVGIMNAAAAAAAGSSFRSNVSLPDIADCGSGKVAKSHSEAERRRRQRINAHLSTLRTLLPHTAKMDKASLLTEVVRQVRVLKKYADDVAALSPDTWKKMVPGVKDEVRMDRMTTAEETGLIGVSICCEDRPGLMSEVNQAIRSVQARLIRAEMATVGGRTKSVVVMEGDVEGEDRAMLHASLRAVMQKPGLTGNRFFENKRMLISRSPRIT